jgi:hypothetical protein
MLASERNALVNEIEAAKAAYQAGPKEPIS